VIRLSVGSLFGIECAKSVAVGERPNKSYRSSKKWQLVEISEVGASVVSILGCRVAINFWMWRQWGMTFSKFNPSTRVIRRLETPSRAYSIRILRITPCYNSIAINGLGYFCGMILKCNFIFLSACSGQGEETAAVSSLFPVQVRLFEEWGRNMRECPMFTCHMHLLLSVLVIFTHGGKNSARSSVMKQR